MERAPSPGQLLEAWELGRSQTPARRASILLALAGAEAASGDPAAFTIGRRDQELLALRERLFGSRLTGTSRCPHCGTEVELNLSVGDLRLAPAPDPAPEHELTCEGYALRFRLPTAGDLELVGGLSEPAQRRTCLLERCVTATLPAGPAVAAPALPPAVIARVVQRMAELDPAGDIRLGLQCPDCAHEWTPPFDVASYLWLELQAWVGRLLREVHELATAYGWREPDILSLSPWRRQAYLDLIRQ